MKNPSAAEPVPPAFAHCAEYARLIRSNPFYVLELAPDAPRAEVERTAARLLGLLEIGSEKAAVYPTPFGSAPRTPQQVRQALAELRDPARRCAHEIWAAAAAHPGPAFSESMPGWLEAQRAVGSMRMRVLE